jgi:hypothetical protein
VATNQSGNRAPAAQYPHQRRRPRPVKAAIGCLLPNIRINAADPGLTATGLSGGQDHSVHDGTGAIIACAFADRGGPTGTFADRDGEVPW